MEVASVAATVLVSTEVALGDMYVYLLENPKQNRGKGRVNGEVEAEVLALVGQRCVASAAIFTCSSEL